MPKLPSGFVRQVQKRFLKQHVLIDRIHGRQFIPRNTNFHHDVEPIVNRFEYYMSQRLMNRDSIRAYMMEFSHLDNKPLLLYHKNKKSNAARLRFDVAFLTSKIDPVMDFLGILEESWIQDVEEIRRQAKVPVVEERSIQSKSKEMLSLCASYIHKIID